MRHSTQEMLVQLSIESNQKDAIVSKLRSQIAALTATVDAFTQDNSYLREQNEALDRQLRDKWTMAEVLASMCAKMEAVVTETQLIINSDSNDRHLHSEEHANRVQDSEVHVRTQRAPNPFSDIRRKEQPV